MSPATLSGDAVFGSIAGQVALVTGAGSPDGIGFAIARALAALGSRVVIVATSDRIHGRAAEIGGAATGHIADLANEAAVEGLIGEVVERHGPLSIVVNNAGMASTAAGTDAAKPLEAHTLAEWNDTIARNLSTAFLVCRATLPAMRAAGYGRIINVASTSGPVSAFPDGSAYAAAKSGMVGMTRALAIETAASGITVNAVAPGWIRTSSASEAEHRAGAASPIGRSGTPHEVAAAVAFLATPSASYITGTMLVIDGGNAVAEDHSNG